VLPHLTEMSARPPEALQDSDSFSSVPWGLQHHAFCFSFIYTLLI